MSLLNKCAVLVVLGSVASLNAQKSLVLSDAEVTAAIERGDQKNHRIGLELFEMGQACHACSTSGYEIIIYNSAQWIEQAAMNAKRKLTPFAIADVTPEMRQPLLYAVAWPDTPNGGSSILSGSGVQKIVLADEAQQLLIQLLTNEPGTVNSSNAFRSQSYSKVLVTFSMEDVAKVRGANGTGEFFLVVVGDTHKKTFKIKSKMFDRIF